MHPICTQKPGRFGWVFGVPTNTLFEQLKYDIRTNWMVIELKDTYHFTTPIKDKSDISQVLRPVDILRLLKIYTGYSKYFVQNPAFWSINPLFTLNLD